MKGNPSLENESSGSLINMLRLQASEIRRLAAENSELKKKHAVYEDAQSQKEQITCKGDCHESLTPKQITPEQHS